MQSMAEIVDIPLADLLIDTRNARLKTEQPSQPAALLALAMQQGSRLLRLATDIVENGLDPITLPGVIPTSDQKKRYTVIEGNRRIVALKALETPSLVAPAFKAVDQKRLNRLANRYAQKPIPWVKCVLFESESEADHWVTLRHTGPNEGIGLVEWGADEKDRYSARHGRRSPAGQILDFLDKQSSPGEGETGKRIFTNIRRLINTPAVRERLGIDLSGGELLSWYPAPEITKGLGRLVDDLRSERIKVGDIYYEKDRIQYANSFPREDLPNPKSRLPVAIPLGELGSRVAEPRKPSDAKPKPKPRKRKAERTALIPRECQLNIAPPRINSIYLELLTLSVDQFSNACSVLLRVFVELSVDHYVDQNGLMTESDRRNANLAKRLKVSAGHLATTGKISAQLETAVQKIADTRFVLAASTVTFNQYVHNQYVLPKATELKVAWDELQPFVEKLWA